MSKIKLSNQKVIASEYKKLKPDRKVGTKLEEKKREKKEIGEQFERIETIGQESETKAVKWVQEDVKDSEKEKKETFSSELEWLTYKRRFKDEGYLVALASILHKNLREVDFPLNYRFSVEIRGVLLSAEIRDPFNRRYTKGIKVTGEPKYDLNAVLVMANEAENTLEHLEGNDEARKTKEGLYLPPSIKL